MRVDRCATSSQAAFMVAMLLVAAVPAAAESPVDPARGPETLAVADGLTATLFAAEPMLSSPANIDVDARGRVWVCEVVNYRGKKDTRPEGDRILVLDDTDGDGRADRQTVFHQGRDIDSALGICVIGEGPGRKVIVSCSPDVFIFHDDDGDLVADRRESLFTKIGAPQHDHSVHAFVVGPDGRFFFNFGNTGKAVHDAEGRPVTDRFGNVVNADGKPYLQGMVFRCRPDGSDFEVLAHNFRNNFEVAVDSFGDLWQSDNDDDGNRSVRINYVMPWGNYGYVDEKTRAGWPVPRTNLEAEVPQRHWHQNDPGVVPNLLVTGAGSPTGICVYEGRLLPDRYHGAVLHCDAGPNVVRAYCVKPSGAGYQATIEPIADGSADRWFRPSDVCVAPDGSIIVADWYDPGVGGHGMADTEKGRIYRIAPPGSRWSVPPLDVASIDGAIRGLASPNLCTRAICLDRLAREPAAAAPALSRAFETEREPRLRARLAWAAAMLPGASEEWVARLSSDNDESFRVIALRLCRLTKGDVLGLVEKFTGDPSPAVRREAAISLRGIQGDRAARAWATLATRHTPRDRWNLEALGIGADGRSGIAGASDWDPRLSAWLAMVGDGWDSSAGREIVWRSRAAATPAMLCRLIADPATSTNESLALLRALDFQDDRAVQEAVGDAVRGFAAAEEKLRVVLPELAIRLSPSAMADAELSRRIDEAADIVDGTQRFVDLMQRFRLKDRWSQVIALAAGTDTPPQLAANAALLALDGGAVAEARNIVLAGTPESARLLQAIGSVGSKPAVALLAELSCDPKIDAQSARMALQSLAKSRLGAEKIVSLATERSFADGLRPVAAQAIAAVPWSDVKASATNVLPMPVARGGQKLPPVSDLIKRSGQPERGKAVFMGVGTCSKCHVVGSEGKAVGPQLTEIGSKLSREALYESILAPSAAISHNFETWTAVLGDGRIITGLLVSQAPDQVVMKGPDGIEATIARGEIEELTKLPVSLMPSDLAATLSAEELVDLVTWLETLRPTR
ncbi:MAG: PVC-type heme-binding CxxCH protein [Planctomycetia bacterium]